ncbi:hypothetical protein [Mucilaginibacter lacusdianchii]|uniref:hypothetical protein n=1 Tax=Mucilaginibacter lacusdianchii TaxID=2684211 RepID=UPI00131BDDFB|nr:hypothetical protein [Mucilaginibacter sp. JXJ CY 39]
MKTTILKGVVLISALALASCSTTNQLASSTKQDDDVYFSDAKAGDQPEYRQVLTQERYVNADESADEDDYYYYDSYSSRINRFNYSSPFGYYDDYYYGYSPYGNGAYAYGSPYGYGYGGGWGLNVGLGFGYGYGGYGPYGYSPFGYGYYGYSPYSYWGTGYGLGYGGGYPYWGVYSAYSRYSNPRPYRGSGVVGANNMPVRGTRTGYTGAYPNTMNYPGRTVYSNGSSGSAYGRSTPRNGSNGNYVPQARPQRGEIERPVYQPSSTRSSSSGMGGGMSGGGGGSRGGGRPSRP